LKAPEDIETRGNTGEFARRQKDLPEGEKANVKEKPLQENLEKK